MSSMRSRVFIGTYVLLWASSLIGGASGLADINENAAVGIFFRHRIDVSQFVSNTTSSLVSFTASSWGNPDLPSWLHLEQGQPSDPAIMYGTPPADAPPSLGLEITGWDKRTYDTQRRNMSITVSLTGGVPRYQVELLITNHNLDEFLEQNESAKFLQRMQDTCWRTDNGPQVTLVESALDRGGRIPLPRNNQSKNMVYVAVGGKNQYRVFEDAAKPNCVKECSLEPNYNVDWSCGASRLIDMQKASRNDSANNMTAAKRFAASGYVARDFDASARDFSILFILILILPIALVLLIVMILACIICGYREGREHRDAETPTSQLQHHNSILRATFQLRQMSHQNGEPARSSSPTPAEPSAARPRQTSTPYSHGTPRFPEADKPDAGFRGAPPPYQLPPPAAINVSTPDGRNQYYPATDHSGSQRPPPFMNSSDLQ